MTAPAVRPVAPPAGVPGAPVGAQKRTTVYYDETGREHRAAEPVPTDKFGRIVGEKWRCPRCDVDEWHQAGNRANRMAPVCERCERAMQPLEVKDASRLPWGAMWGAVERPLRPVWALAGTAAAGVIVDASDASALVFVPAAVGAYFGVSRWWRRRAQKAAARRAQVPLDVADPFGQPKIRAAIDRAARACGLTAAAAVGWLTVPAAVGVPADDVVGHVAVWGSLLAGWVLPAASWWRAERDARVVPEPEAVFVEVPDAGPQVDAEEAEVLRIWSEVVAVRQGQNITGPDGQPAKATANGKLPGTSLQDWRRIEGGWSATVVGPVGAYESDQFAAAPAKIASAYRMHRSMVTVMPDPEDENRAIVMAQRKSPLRDTVRWAGPESIDAVKGTAEVGRYVDGSPLMYELYRPGWGCPHDFMCGTTGAGKSETLSGLLAVDRWAHYTDEDGVKHGLVADLLIDPQQGQSYEPFMDDLAAPVATSLEEAMMMVEAFRAEMLRRNEFLSKRGWRDKHGVVHRPEWVDGRNRVRYGRKWWNPLVDGPLLTLNIDEAHEYLAHKPFATLVTAGARMYRKCGMRIRVATHTPLLSDLGGSMALRDMLTGGFVWVGRTANGLSGPTAFNGRLPVDPRSIPAIPGSGFTLGQLSNKPMMSRFMWEPDYYDLVRDENEQPVGFPAELPPHTLEAFNAGTSDEFGRWSTALRAGDDWAPSQQIRDRIEVAAKAEATTKCVDAVRGVLAAAAGPLNMDQIDEALNVAGTPFATRTVRDALADLRREGLVSSVKGRHELSQQGRAVSEDDAAAREEQEQLALDEGGDW